MSAVVLYYCQAIYGIDWFCDLWVSSICIWGVSFGAVTIGILCWDGSLAVLVLFCRRPTPHFAAGWAVSVPIGVGTFCLFCYATIQLLLLVMFISFSLYAFLCIVAVI